MFSKYLHGKLLWMISVSGYRSMTVIDPYIEYPEKTVLLDKEVVVNFVDGDFFGCEFTDLAKEEKELGFFLFM